MDLGLKQKRFSSPAAQVADWKNKFPKLEGSVDPEALEGVLSGSYVPPEEKPFFFPFVLPKFEKLFGKNQPTVYLELWLLDALRQACSEQNITLCIDRNFNGEKLVIEREGYRAYFDLCAKQKGDFVVFPGQMGHVRPYRERTAHIALSRNEHYLPLGILAALLCPQEIERFWSPDRNRWIASQGSGIANGGQNRLDIPGIKFHWNFGGGSNSIEIAPLSNLFYMNPSERSLGGFVSAIFTT